MPASLGLQSFAMPNRAGTGNIRLGEYTPLKKKKNAEPEAGV
jgi:hypothetical protein